MGDSHRRTAVKALSWRLFASMTTVSLVFVFTGQLVVSLGVGAAEMIAKSLIYYVHERIWTRIDWGQK